MTSAAFVQRIKGEWEANGCQDTTTLKERIEAKAAHDVKNLGSVCQNREHSEVPVGEDFGVRNGWSLRRL